jgi:dolichol-phosphate mannosyltransferase
VIIPKMALSSVSKSLKFSFANPAGAKKRVAKMLDISILVPVMNEAGNIRPLIDEICTAMAGRQFEIIYIDDASDDATVEELLAILGDVPQLRVLRHTKRAGQSAAIRSGLLRASGALVGILDGDGQNVPTDFPALEAAMTDASKDGVMVMAAGIRQRRNDSPMRLLASRGARWVRTSLLGDTHPDSGCGIKILPRDLFMQLPFFDHMHRFMPSLVRRHGGIVVGVPVAHRARIVGASKYGIVDRLLVGIYDIIGVIWLLRRGPAQGHVTEIMVQKTGRQRNSKKVGKNASKRSSERASKGLKDAAQ